jgi:hypothetical protein
MLPEEILAEYPDLEPDDLRACYAYSADVIASERVYSIGRRQPSISSFTSIVVLSVVANARQMQSTVSQSCLNVTTRTMSLQATECKGTKVGSFRLTDIPAGSTEIAKSDCLRGGT